MIDAVKKAKKMLSDLSLVDLVDEWEMLDSLALTPDAITARGWMMDEFKNRDEEKFDAWIEDGADSPREFFI